MAGRKRGGAVSREDAVGGVGEIIGQAAAQDHFARLRIDEQPEEFPARLEADNHIPAQPERVWSERQPDELRGRLPSEPRRFQPVWLRRAGGLFEDRDVVGRERDSKTLSRRAQGLDRAEPGRRDVGFGPQSRDRRLGDEMAGDGDEFSPARDVRGEQALEDRDVVEALFPDHRVQAVVRGDEVALHRRSDQHLRSVAEERTVFL